MARNPLNVPESQRPRTEHDRGYDPETGWWTRPADTSQPTSGQQQGGGDE